MTFAANAATPGNDCDAGGVYSSLLYITHACMHEGVSFN